MAITPFNNELPEPKRFGSDQELFTWMTSNTKGKYASAKAAVNDWWKSVTESLYYADVHFGWDALDPESCSSKVMPPELAAWCDENGIDTPAKIYKARAIYRASLLTNSPIEYLIEEVGVSKAKVIGNRAQDTKSAENLLHAAQSGVTEKDLRKHPLYSTTLDPKSVPAKDLKDSTADLKAKDFEIEKLRNQVKGLSDLTPQLKAENDRLKTELSAAKSVEPEVITKVETKVDNTKVRRLEEKVAALTQQIADGPKLPEGGAAALNARQTCESFSVQVGTFHGNLAEFISSPKDQISSEFLDQIRSRLVAIHTDIDKYLTPKTIQITPTTIDV